MVSDCCRAVAAVHNRSLHRPGSRGGRRGRCPASRASRGRPPAVPNPLSPPLPLPPAATRDLMPDSSALDTPPSVQKTTSREWPALQSAIDEPHATFVVGVRDLMPTDAQRQVDLQQAYCRSHANIHLCIHLRLLLESFWFTIDSVQQCRRTAHACLALLEHGTQRAVPTGCRCRPSSS